MSSEDLIHTYTQYVNRLGMKRAVNCSKDECKVYGAIKDVYSASKQVAHEISSRTQLTINGFLIKIRLGSVQMTLYVGLVSCQLNEENSQCIYRCDVVTLCIVGLRRPAGEPP
jgi:hypothetical protein